MHALVHNQLNMKCLCKAVSRGLIGILQCQSRKLSRKYKQKTVIKYTVLVKPFRNTVAYYLAYALKNMLKTIKTQKNLNLTLYWVNYPNEFHLFTQR